MGILDFLTGKDKETKGLGYVYWKFDEAVCTLILSAEPEDGALTVKYPEARCNNSGHLYKTNVDWFPIAEQIRKVVIKNEIQPASTAYWFNNCINIQCFEGLENLDTSHVRSMAGMFRNCGYNELEELRLGPAFNTAHVGDMSEMFAGCGYEKMKILDLGPAFDTGEVNDMSSMFADCGYMSMEELNLGEHFNTRKTYIMDNMFHSCGYCRLKKLDLGHKFDMSNVRDMDYMFFDCGYMSMEELDLGAQFDMRCAGDCTSAFMNCGYEKLKGIQVSGDLSDSETLVEFMSLLARKNQ